MNLPASGDFRLEDELDRHWLRWTLLIWLVVAVSFLWMRWNNVYWLALGDTDDNMRLMQVRALLHGQGWYDLRQYRLDPALGGYNIHWSRIVDLPIAGIILLLKPFTGYPWAERFACGFAPLIPLGIAMVGMSLTIRRLISPYIWPLGQIILVFACTSTILMFAPERIDHHGWQLAALAMTVAGLADPKRARGGLVVGLFSALSLNIGMELMPYCAMAGAIVALRWVWDRGEVRRLQAYALSLSGGCAIGFALFASYANMAMRCDALTPVWLSTVVMAGGLLFLLSLAPVEKRWVRLLLAALAGAAIAVLFAKLFPQCLGRPEQVSPELERIWLNNVREARPIYRHALSLALPIAALPVIGILGAGIATWRARKTEAVVGWAAVLLFTIFAGAMLLWQIRAGPAAQMLSVPGATSLALVLLTWFLNLRFERHAAFFVRLLRIAPESRLAKLIVPQVLAVLSVLVRVFGSVAAFLAVTGLFTAFVPKFVPIDTPNPGTQRVNQANADCTRVTRLRALNAIPAATMFTHVDLGPRLIVITHHNGVAGPYHRNERAILDVHHAFTGPASAFRGIAAPHRAQYLLICPNMAETTVYRARSPNGFYAQLAKGQVPNWLEPVPLPDVEHGKPAPFRLWKIRYDLPDVPARPVSAPKSPAPPPAKP